MRKTLLFLLLLCTKLTFAQLNENFADGSFSKWKGTTDYFQVKDGFLQSKGVASSGTLYLATPNALASNTVWEFYLKLAFDPSTTNYPRIYLTSNREDLTSTTGMQAYYLQLGSSSSAENFFLVRQNGSTTSPILTLPDKPRPSASSVNVRVRVERDVNGRWDIYTDFTGGTNFTFDGSVVDNTYTTTSFFGVYCRYTTISRIEQFYFTDIKAANFVPSPPKLLSVKTLDDKTFEVTFDKALSATTALLAANYSFSGGVGSPSAVEWGDNAAKVKLTYPTAISSGNYTLTANHIADVRNNPMTEAQSVTFLHIKKYNIQPGDLIFNEIYANNKGVLGLPNAQYIELFNKSNEYLIVTGLKFRRNEDTRTLVFTADTIAPKQFLLLASNAGAPLFKTYGKAMGLTSWTALNLGSGKLTLYDDADIIIDQVSYVDTWYQDEAKRKDGGYSLELVNPYSGCDGAANWKASIATIGGTPGTQNSIFETQLVAPKLLSADILTVTKVNLFFDRPLNANTLNVLTNYSINNGVGSPTSVEIAFDNKSVTLTFATSIARGLVNKLTLQNLTSCGGTVIDPNANSAELFLAKEIKPNDILISEVLFNQKKDGHTFVEIYNNTDHVLDLRELTISNPAATAASGQTKRVISAIPLYIQPKAYWVLTGNIETVKSQYNVTHPEQMVRVASMPTYNNGSGTVTLWKDDVIIDQLSYTEKMHHPLLKDVKGVSLERVSFTKSANEPGNLQSAAASADFATPTDVNSQQEDASVKNSVALVNKTFSPDNDGFDDLLQIDYRFKENGNLATINIYTDKGVLVRKLVRNLTMATAGTVTWDGLNDGGQLCKVGLYIVKVDVFNLNGNTDKFTKTCVLASKLN